MHIDRRWYDAEPGWTRAKHELQRMKVRAKRRWVLTLLVAVALTAFAVYRASKKRKLFKASTTYEIREERTSSGDRVPHTKSDLKDYVYDGVFTKERVKAMRAKYKLFERIWNLDEQWALDKVRDAISVKVFRNYFTSDDTEIERSARVRISFTYTDPQIALDVTRELGKMVKDAEREARRNISESVAESTRQALASSEAQHQRLYERMAALRRERDNVIKGSLRYATLTVEIEAVNKRAEAVRDRMSVIRVNSLAERLRARIERKSLGLQFKQISFKRPPKPKLSRSTELTIVGVLVFIIVLPFAGLGVAIADPKVYTMDDVRQLGFEPLGHVPRYPGWKTGAMRSRKRIELSKSH